MLGSRFASSLSSLLALVALAPGCHLEERYLTPRGAAPGTPFTAVITPDTPPLIGGRDDTLYAVETPIEFPIHAPTDEERMALWRGDSTPFRRFPWVARDAILTEVDLVISNLELDRSVLVTATINGRNEFFVYVPGATIIDDAVQPDFAGWERTYYLAPGERRLVTVREEELDEVTVDLASVVNGAECMAIANTITYFMNQSSIDPRSVPCVPTTTIPGLVGLGIGLRVNVEVGDTPPNVLLEASVRLRDQGNRVAASDETPWRLPTPIAFSPPPPMVP